MIKRPNLTRQIARALKRSRVVALIGPRQCGKTTMAREWVSTDSPNYFDLEDPQSLARFDQPLTALKSLKGVVVIDEVQRRPEPLSDFAHPRRPNTPAGSVPDPGERVIGFSQAIRRVIGRES